MNAVEIEEAVSKLAEAPFDAEAFPYAFLEAFGNKETTLKRLKSGNTNQSDLAGAVLQRNNIHLKVCPEGEVTATLAALRQSAATGRHKAKFILATDGKGFEAENLVDGETVACAYADFHDHFGSHEFIQGIEKRCIWIEEAKYDAATENEWLKARFDAVRLQRLASDRQTTRDLASSPFRFGEVRQRGTERTIVIPGVSSQVRPYLPCGLLPPGTIVSNKNFALYDAQLWNVALIASRMHLVWVATICVRLRTDFSYSNTLGWNTFPVPALTDQNQADLTRCAEGILLAREAHFPATIADLYDPEAMDTKYPDLRTAHERNDETLERIYIGRRFRNDTERLEKLFELYTQMTARQASTNTPAMRKAKPS